MDNKEKIYWRYYFHPGISTTWLSLAEKNCAIDQMCKDEKNGDLDKDSFLPLKSLNTVEGLATIYSCTGHKGKVKDEEGYILFRTTKEVGKNFDELVIPKLWEENLIHGSEKIWQSGKDYKGQIIPVIRFIVRFFPNNFAKVAESIMKYVL